MIGLALLGAGRMAKVHAEAISAAGARLVTVFDVAEPAAALSLQRPAHPWLGQLTVTLRSQPL
jgi:hypothetical protein